MNFALAFHPKLIFIRKREAKNKRMNEPISKSILNELPTKIRESITQHALQTGKSVDHLIEQWVIEAAKKLKLSTPTK